MPSVRVCTSIHLFCHRPPCHAATHLYCSSLHYSTSSVTTYKWLSFDCKKKILSLPTMLVGFPAGHVNTTSANRTQIKMFVRYNNVRVLPWTISVLGAALFRKRSASRPPKGAAPHNTWRSDCRYLGSTPGCEAKNSTSGGAAYSKVACRKPDSGKGKGTLRPVTYHEGATFKVLTECTPTVRMNMLLPSSGQKWLGWKFSLTSAALILSAHTCCWAWTNFLCPLSRRSEWPQSLQCVRINL